MAFISRLNFQRIFIISAILAMMLTYIIEAAIILNDPVQRTAADFIAFYAAGKIAKEQGIARIYQVDLQRQVEQGQINFVLGEKQLLLYNHLPYLIPVLALLISDNFGVSFLLWMLLLTCITLVSLSILNNLIPGQTRSERWNIIASWLVFLPVFASIANGQDTAFLLLGVSIFIYGMLNQRETLAGLALSLLTLRPQMALFFAVPLFFWSHKALRAYLLGSIALAILSLSLLGMQGSLDFIHLLQISASGEWFGMSETAMFNLLGLVLRLFPGIEAELARQITWVLFILTGLGTVLFFARSKIANEKKFGFAIVVFLLTSPHLHYHDLSLLLIPIFMIVREECQQDIANLKKISLALIGLDLSLFLTNNVPFLYYSIPYVLMGLLAFGLLQLDRLFYLRSTASE